MCTLACWFNLRYISKSWTDRCTHMEQSLADRGHREELIDTKLRRCAFDGQPTTALPSIPPGSDMDTCLLIMRYISKSWLHRCTHMEQSLADSGDGEESIHTKPGSVHFMDNRLQPSQLCLQLLIWALSCWLCSRFLNLERIDAHPWNKV